MLLQQTIKTLTQTTRHQVTLPKMHRRRHWLFTRGLIMVMLIYVKHLFAQLATKQVTYEISQIPNREKKR